MLIALPPLHALTHHLCRLAQKQAPTYGAIPTAADVKKQREGEEEEKVWREEFVYSLLQPDALKRLNQTEQDNAAKVLSLPRHVSIATVQPRCWLLRATPRVVLCRRTKSRPGYLRWRTREPKGWTRLSPTPGRLSRKARSQTTT